MTELRGGHENAQIMHCDLDLELMYDYRTLQVLMLCSNQLLQTILKLYHARQSYGVDKSTQSVLKDFNLSASVTIF